MPQRVPGRKTVSAHPRDDPATVLTWMQNGESFLAEQLAGLDLSAASLLPGWTRAQVAAHLASNARALGNLLHWARTGQETPMYPSPEARGREIDESAAHPDDEIRAAVTKAAEQLYAAVGSLPEQAWAARVRSALGRDIPAAEVPWLRVREAWIHAVDLGGRVWFDAFPSDLVDALLSEVCSALGSRHGCPDVLLVPQDREHTWAIGEHVPDAARAEGTAADLLGWTIGRPHPGRGVPAGRPPLPRWL